MTPALRPSPPRITTLALHRLPSSVAALAAAAASSWLLFAAPARIVFAQEEPARAADSVDVANTDRQTPAAVPDQPEVLVDPDTGERYVEVRPEEGLARGRWPTDRLVVIGVVSVLVLLAGLALGRRISRSRT